MSTATTAATMTTMVTPKSSSGYNPANSGNLATTTTTSQPLNCPETETKSNSQLCREFGWLGDQLHDGTLSNFVASSAKVVDQLLHGYLLQAEELEFDLIFGLPISLGFCIRAWVMLGFLNIRLPGSELNKPAFKRSFFTPTE